MNAKDKMLIKASIVLVILVLAAGLVLPPATAHALDGTKLNADIMGTPKIYIVAPDPKHADKTLLLGTCSGSFITPDGYILTNFHCVGHTDLYGPDDTGLGLKDGDLYNADGFSIIAPTLNAKQAPQPTYVAKFIVGSSKLDVAVIKIVGMVDSKAKLPRQLPIVVNNLGDASDLEMGDFVGVIGYPGAGGDLITFTEGTVAGFEDEGNTGQIDSLKVTSKINPGNSGGTAVNDSGDQIGIATYSSTKGTDNIGRVKMINIASSFITEALRKGGSSSSISIPPPIAVPATPTPSATQPPSKSPRPTPTKTPKAPSNPRSAAIVLKGIVLDADTQRDIPGALFGALKPGVTFQDFTDHNSDESMIAAQGVTDVKGNFQTSPALARNETYTIFLVAEHYRGRYADNALQLGANDPAVIEFDKPFALQKK